MKYLLDVNVLVALCVTEHEFHERVASWMNESVRAGRSELIVRSDGTGISTNAGAGGTLRFYD